MRRAGVLLPFIRAAELGLDKPSDASYAEAVLLYVMLHWAGLERSVYETGRLA
jgi:hypothetical protein